MLSGDWELCTAQIENYRMEYQNTINKEFRLTGPGLHTGRTVTVTVKPAPDNFGIAFRRTDRTNIITQPALADRVGETSRGTTLGSGRNSIATIEHKQQDPLPANFVGL